MEGANKLLVTDLTITQSKGFRFLDDELDETIFVNQMDDLKQTAQNIGDVKLLKVLKHPLRNEFLDELNISWLHCEVLYPELYISKEIFQKILLREIPDALALSHNLLKEYNMHQYIDSGIFLEKVLMNPQVDTQDRLLMACQLIHVNSDKALLVKLEHLLKRMFNDQKLSEVIAQYSNADLKIDINKPTIELKYDWHSAEVNYRGSIDLPDNIQLLKSRKEIRAFGGGDERRLFNNLMSKRAFYIGVKAERNLIFEITPYYSTEWFKFHEITGRVEGYGKFLKEAGSAISNKENQEFFQKNFNAIGNLNVGLKSSIAALLEDVL